MEPALSLWLRLLRCSWSGFSALLNFLFRLFLVLAALAALSYFAWIEIQGSAYFHLKQIEVQASRHMSEAQIRESLSLNVPVNYFQFDTEEAKATLEERPWVLEAQVTKSLPDQLKISLRERVPAGILILETLHLVDSEGQVFVEAQVWEAKDLPIISGLSRDELLRAPEQAAARIKAALDLASLYRQQPLSKEKPLSDLYLDQVGRINLNLGGTRVSIAWTASREKLDHLNKIFQKLEEREMDAEYIILSEDLRRAVVKEIPKETQGDSLTLRPKLK